MSILEKLNKLYDDNVHPQVMKVVNGVGLGDKPFDAADPKAPRTKTVLPNGNVSYGPGEAKDQDAFFRLAGKLSLGSLLAGGIGGTVMSLGRSPAGIASRQGLNVPLTEEEQRAILAEEKKRKQRRKTGSATPPATVDPVAAASEFEKSLGPKQIYNDGKGNVYTGRDKTWSGFLRSAFVDEVLAPTAKPQAELAFSQGKPYTATPADTAKGSVTVPAAPSAGSLSGSGSGSAANSLMDSPWSLPLLSLGIVGAGGLGVTGVKSLIDSRRKKKLQAARDAAKRQFMQELLAERETKLSSAIDNFVSACEEKMTVKEASGTGLFLGLLGAAGALGLTSGFYNGLNSEPNDLRRIKALRAARAKQLALRDEYLPDVTPDFEALAIPHEQKLSGLGLPALEVGGGGTEP